MLLLNSTLHQLTCERRGGMYQGYKVQHEKVIWDART